MMLTCMCIGIGNGIYDGHTRYHGMPQGYVVPIESPQAWHMTPMQASVIV